MDVVKEIAILKERLCGFKKLLDERQVYNEKALSLAAESLAHKLETMNEFRYQIEKERATYITKKELDLIVENIRKDIKPLTYHKSYSEGVSKTWLTVGGIIILLVNLLAAWLIKGA